MMTKNNPSSTRVLLADDGSQYSLAAATMVCDLLSALPPGGERCVTILGVLSPLESSNYEVRQAALLQTQTLLRKAGIQAEIELSLGYPAVKILEFADGMHPDLIVLGARGLRATLGILLGGVAQQVVEYSNWPVLIVRPPYTGLQRVGLVIDGSSCSQVAVNYLTGKPGMPHFPYSPSLEVRVAHVLPPMISPEHLAMSMGWGPEIVPTVSEAVEEKLEEEERLQTEAGQLLVEQTVQRLEQAGIPATSILMRGDAATEIIEYSKNEKIDMIVAGSRGLSALKGWFLGSVSRKLVHYAPHSVLIAKCPQQGGHETTG